jgi:polysaccharide export outer membrane protein
MLRALPAFLVLALAALPARAAAQTASPDTIFVRSGDAIQLSVWRQPELSGEFPVGSDGTIQHPLLSSILVAGVPRSVIRARLTEALSRLDREPRFVFDFRYRVAVGGDVRLPGLYRIAPQTTVAEAIATAGGANSTARLDRVVLVRPGNRIVVDLLDPDVSAAATQLRSGDEIRVPRARVILRDIIGPVAAIVGALGAVVSLFR